MVFGRIVRTGQKSNHPLRQNGNGKNRQPGRHQARIVPRKRSGTQNDPHNLRPQDDKKKDDRQRPKDNGPGRFFQMLLEFIFPTAPERFGQGRKSRHRVRNADNIERNGLEIEGKIKYGNRTAF